MTTVLRTGKMHVFDMAVDTFKEAGIPHFTHQESSSGLTTALSAMPTPGPGCYFVIDVPEECSAEANHLLKTLPFATGTDPEVWEYNDQSRPISKWVPRLVLGGLAAWVLHIIYLLFVSH